MKNILLALISLFTFTYSVAQDPWIRILGSNYYNPEPISIRETYDKAVLVHYRYQAGQNSPSQTKLQKLDVNGLNTLWQLTFGSETNNSVIILGLDETPDGGLFLYGDAKKNTVQYPTPFIMKLNACMEKEWCKIDTSQNSYALSAIALPDGNFVTLRIELDTTVNYIISKLDASGRTIWKNNYASSDPDLHPNNLLLKYCEPDNTLILTGDIYVHLPADSMNIQYPYISKLSTDGVLLWDTYLTLDPPVTFALISSECAISSSGNITSSFNPGWESQTFVYQVDAQGNLIYTSTLHQPDTVQTYVNSMESYPADKILLGVQRYHNEGGALNSSLLMFDGNANLLDETFIDENFPDITVDIAITSDHKILCLNIYEEDGLSLIKLNRELEYDSIYTNTSAFEYDSKCDHRIESATIDMDCSSYGLDEPAFEMKAELLPNPASGFLVVRLPEMILNNEKQGPYNVTSASANYIKDLKLQIFDINGCKVIDLPWPDNTTEQVISTGSLNQGLYLLRISAANRFIAKGKFVIKR